MCFFPFFCTPVEQNRTDHIRHKKEMQNNGCIGSIAELYDSVKPQLPKGAIAQGWSVAEIFRIILKR